MTIGRSPGMTPPASPRWSIRVTALLAVALVVGALLAMPVAGRRAAAATMGDYATRLATTLISTSPTVVTAESATTLTINAEITNTGDDPIDGLSYRFQRGEALGDMAALSSEVSDPSQPSAVITHPFQPLPGSLDHGARRQFTVTVPVGTAPTAGESSGGDGDSTSGHTETSGLAIDEPGVYPLMININGTIHHNGTSFAARVGELHLLVTVASVPSPGGGDDAAHAPSTVGMLWPLTSTPQLGVGGVFRDDSLARSVAPGGRLYRILSLAADDRVPPGLVTLAIDPMLLDELDRMAHGYAVLADPDSPQPRLTPETAPVTTSGDTSAIADDTTTASETPPPPSGPDTPTVTGSAATGSAATGPTGRTDAGGENGAATTAGTTPATESTATGTSAGETSAGETAGSPPPGTVAGTGVHAAAAFLTKLRVLAAETPVVVLPYGDPDVVALTRAGMTDAIVRAIDHGRAVAARLLQAPAGGPEPHLITDVALPPHGVITDAAWQVLRSHGFTSVVLDPAGSTTDRSSESRASPGSIVTLASDGDNTAAVLSGGVDAVLWSSLLTDGRPDEADRRLNVAVARRLLGPATITVLVAPRSFTAHRSGLSAVISRLRTLSAAGLLQPASVPDLAQHRVMSTTPSRIRLRYPAAARQRELPQSYLADIATLRAQITQLGRTLAPAPNGPDPRQLLTPLADALVPAASSSLRGQDHPNSLIRHTVAATIDGLYDGVGLQEDDTSYTLASATAPLLLTVHNDLPYEVTVRLEILGGRRAGLTTDDPGAIHIQAGPHSRPVTIESRVSRSGTFSVYAQLTGPEHQAWGDPVRLTIHSRAYGALTVILMIVAGGVLLLMVAWQLTQRWRRRGQQPTESDRDPDDPGDTDDDPGDTDDSTSNPDDDPDVCDDGPTLGDHPDPDDTPMNGQEHRP